MTEDRITHTPVAALELTGEAYHHTVSDVLSLAALTRPLNNQPVIVNIGACFGTSALALLEAKPEAVIFSIDVAECPLEREHIQQAGLDTTRVIRVLGRSQEIGLYWPQPVDMVFVDGQHDRQAVVDDIHAWRRHVKPGGIIAFHDYGAPICPEVKPAVDSVMGDIEPLLEQGTLKAFML